MTSTRPAHERDPLPMVDDVPAARRRGRRLWTITAVCIVAWLLVVVVGRIAIVRIAEPQDVAAAEACRTFENIAGLHGRGSGLEKQSPNPADVGVLSSEDPGRMVAAAAPLTGRWTELRTLMTQAAGQYDSDAFREGEVLPALETTMRVVEVCDTVPAIAQQAARIN